MGNSGSSLKVIFRYQAIAYKGVYSAWTTNYYHGMAKASVFLKSNRVLQYSMSYRVLNKGRESSALTFKEEMMHIVVFSS
jgi:hypothetical protein